jgi:hypothetical protein
MERRKTESPPATLLAAAMPLRAFTHSNKLSVLISLSAFSVCYWRWRAEGAQFRWWEEQTL